MSFLFISLGIFVGIIIVLALIAAFLSWKYPNASGPLEPTDNIGSGGSDSSSYNYEPPSTKSEDELMQINNTTMFL